MLPAMGGSNLIYGLGMLELGVTFSYTQLVLDAEITKMVRRVVRGIDVNDDTLAVEEIKDVEPGGNFLTQQHTLDYMHEEQARADIFDRKMRENWEKGGGRIARETAEERAKEILETHEPEPLDDAVLDRLQEIRDSVK